MYNSYWAAVSESSMASGPIASKGPGIWLGWLAQRRMFSPIGYGWRVYIETLKDIKIKSFKYNFSIISIVETPFCFALLIMGDCFVTKHFYLFWISSEYFHKDSEWAQMSDLCIRGCQQNFLNASRCPTYSQIYWQ